MRIRNEIKAYLGVKPKFDEEIDQRLGQPISFVMACNQLQGEVSRDISPILGDKCHTCT